MAGLTEEEEEEAEKVLKLAASFLRDLNRAVDLGHAAHESWSLSMLNSIEIDLA